MTTQLLVLESKNFNLSTRSSAGSVLNADTNFKSQIEFNVPDMIVRDEAIEYIQFSVPYAVIPCSFYTINENNCQLNYRENSGLVQSVNFPLGNYSATLFITTFRRLMNATPTGIGRWLITLDDVSSVFTISNTTNNFTFYNSSSIDNVMGFSTDLTSTLQVLKMTRCCNFLSQPRITMRCNQLANSTMVGDFKSSDIILTIPNNAKPNGQIIYQNQSQSKTLYRGQSMSRFVVSLTDDDGNLLNFNGISSFWVFQFDIYRKIILKPPPFSEIVSYVNSRNTLDGDT